MEFLFVKTQMNANGTSPITTSNVAGGLLGIDCYNGCYCNRPEGVGGGGGCIPNQTQHLN